MNYYAKFLIAVGQTVYERTYADRRKIWARCVPPAFPGHSRSSEVTQIDRVRTYDFLLSFLFNLYINMIIMPPPLGGGIKR